MTATDSSSSPASASAAAGKQRMYGPRIALWASGIAAFVLTVVFVTSGAYAAGLVCFLIAIPAPGIAEVYADRREQRDWFAAEFGTFEHFRAAAGGDALNQLRGGKGDAVRSLRKKYPLLPIAHAARLVNEEPGPTSPSNLRSRGSE